jgi:MerR family copper efflux transcriptional regulator
MACGAGTYRIGEVAARTGLTVDTLRFYDRVGPLPRGRRSAGGFRMYASEVIGRVRFIRQAQIVGMSLAEIRRLAWGLDGADVDRAAAQLSELVAATLDDVETAFHDLEEFRRTLRGYVDTAPEEQRRRDAMRRYSGSGVAVARPTSVKRVDS